MLVQISKGLQICLLSIICSVLSWILTPNLVYAASRNLYYTKIVWDLSDNDLKTITNLAAQVRSRDWNQAFNQADLLVGKYNLSDLEREVRNYIFWKKFSKLEYSSEQMDFDNLSAFIQENRYYPNLTDLQEKLEKVIVDRKISYEQINRYFNNNRVLLPATAVYYANAKVEFIKANESVMSAGDLQRVRSSLKELIASIWVNNDFNVNIENLFLALYRDYLTAEDHIEKLEYLLAKERYASARRINEMITGERKKLYDGILAMRTNPKTINNILDGIPKQYHKNELLLFEMVTWYRKNKQHQLAVETMQKLPPVVYYPSKWLAHRKYYIRELLKDKEYAAAYKLATKHGLSRGSNFAELEWMSGWIALSFLNKPRDAQRHFEKLYARVSYPVSVAKAAYWLGRTMEALKDDNGALKWYTVASNFPVTFYGQLAIYKKDNFLHQVTEERQEIYYSHFILPEEPEITSKDVVRISRMKEVQNAYLNSMSFKNASYTETLMKRAIDRCKTKGEVSLVVNLMKEWEPESNITNLIIRYATSKNVYFVRDLFPISPYIGIEDENSHLLHAIAKQESAFNHRVISRAGAIGYMQLMPATAKEVARKLKIPYSKHRLRTDPKYNIALGSGYIADIKKRFDGSDLLAIATYNAGPTATKRWLNTYYDPRKETDIDKIVDWIELIPYQETRNYVHRIMENAVVYRNLIRQEREKYSKLQPTK